MTGSMMSQNTLFSFSNAEDKDGWLIVNDGVMGGLSKGRFEITANDIRQF